jgi:hypothetical protein
MKGNIKQNGAKTNHIICRGVNDNIAVLVGIRFPREANGFIRTGRPNVLSKIASAELIRHF